MKTRHLRAGLVGAIVLGAGVVSVRPANAATCGEDVPCVTTVTFDVTTSVLEITVPGPPNSANPDLTTDATPDGYAYGNLGAVTVTDARAAADASWTATVTGTDFTTGTAPFEAFETVPAADVYYCSGNPTTTPIGNGTFTPGQTGCAPPPPVTGESLSAARTAFTHTGGTGNNSVTWNPLLTVDTGLEDIGGQYTGTVTHTVT